MTSPAKSLQPTQNPANYRVPAPSHNIQPLRGVVPGAADRGRRAFLRRLANGGVHRCIWLPSALIRSFILNISSVPLSPSLLCTNYTVFTVFTLVFESFAVANKRRLLPQRSADPTVCCRRCTMEVCEMEPGLALILRINNRILLGCHMAN